MKPTHALLAPILLAFPAAAQQLSYFDGEAMAGEVSSDGDRTTFRLSFPSYGTPPIELGVPSENVREVDGGYEVSGRVRLETSRGPLELLNAELFLAGGEGQVRGLRGHCAVPPPFASKRVKVKSPAMAEIGFEMGGKIQLGVPLNRNRAYLYFHFEAGFGVEIATSDEPNASAPITLSIPGGIDGTLILDPTDSFYFLGGAFLASEKKSDDKSKDKDEPSAGDERDDSDEDETYTTGKGRSEQALIPWYPENTRGIGEHVSGFLGQEVQTGSVPVGQLPLIVDGCMVTRFETNADDGYDPFDLGLSPAYRAGANGILSVALPLARMAGGALAEFGFALGRGTASVEVSGERQAAHFTGYVDPDLSWMPNGTPFRPQGEALVVGYLSTEWATSYLDCWGQLGVDVSWFAKLAGIELDEALSAEGYLRADSNGLYVSMKTSAPVGPIVPLGELAVSARYAGKKRSFLRLTGAFELAGQQMDGEIQFDKHGARIAASLRGATTLELKGRLERRSGSLALVAQVVLDDALRGVLQERAKSEARSQRVQVETALAELEAATKNYDIELSLRGMRTVIPKVCDQAISEIDDIPAKIKKEWPKKWGAEAPGRKTATSKAEKDARPARDRLVRLRNAAKGGSDAHFRSELKSAIQSLIDNRRLKISVKLIGTVYDEYLITSKQVSQLKQAIAAVDVLPAASERKIAAREIYDRVPKKAILDDVQRSAENGIAESLPWIEHITVVLPLSAAAGPFSANARVRTGEDARKVKFTCNLRDGTALGADVAQAWVESL